MNVLKAILKIKKAGFCGTLDPLADGVIVVAIKKATKLLPFVTGSDKVYTGKMILGYTSASYDEETELIPSGKDPQTDSIDIGSLIERFSGLIRQVPPVYSAIKVNGKRAYKIARKGGELELKSREVTINSIELEKTGENELSFKVDCSKGTYIRSLVSDIGEFLGCGAVMTQLTRESVGIFSIENSVTLEEIKEDPENVQKGIVNIDAVLSSLYTVDIDESSFNHLRNGLNPENVKLDLIDGYNYIRYENAPAFILLKNEEGVSYHTFLREEDD